MIKKYGCKKLNVNQSTCNIRKMLLLEERKPFPNHLLEVAWGGQRLVLPHGIFQARVLEWGAFKYINEPLIVYA